MIDEAQLDIVRDFIERGRKAQAEIDTIIGKSDRAARARPRARSTDPQTSHVAARKAREGLTAKQQAVLECFIGSEGLTDPELAHKYNLRITHGYGYPRQAASGLRTRRHELVEIGKLEAYRTTEGPGRKFTIWRIK